jgi:hypothetical protein
MNFLIKKTLKETMKRWNLLEKKRKKKNEKE